MSAPPATRPTTDPTLAIVPNTTIAVLRSGPFGNMVATSAIAVGVTIRGGHALQEPGQNEHTPVPGDAAHRRGDGEQRGADDQGALVTDGVTDATAQQQQTTRGQHVDRDHPAPRGVRQSEINLDSRKREDRDGAVHRRQQLNAAERADHGDEVASQPAEAVRRAPGARIPGAVS